jgi:hypothetical protein
MSESKSALSDVVPCREKRIKPSPTRRLRRGKVYYEERRKRVAELRAIGNLTFEQIGERITAYGFEPMGKERVWKDYELFMKESSKALNSVERKSEIVTKMEGLFSLAIMAYKDAQDRTRRREDPDPYAQAILLRGDGDTGAVGGFGVSSLQRLQVTQTVMWSRHTALWRLSVSTALSGLP